MTLVKKPASVEAPVAQPMVAITNEAEHAAAIDQMISWEQQPGAATNKNLDALATAVEAYELAAGHTPSPPSTLRGILEVEMFRLRMRQKQFAKLLGVSESRLSEIMNGRRAPNLDFVKRLHTTLHVSGDKLLELV